MEASPKSKRNVLRSIGEVLAIIIGIPIVVNGFDEYFTKPRAQEASKTFEKKFMPGLSVAELSALATELQADRFQVSGSEDIIGNPKIPTVRVLWKAYHMWIGGYTCAIRFSHEKAESIKCGGDFI
jgi:hypothetical protein